MSRSKLPQFQNDDMAFQQMQNQWASILDPVVGAPIVNGQVLIGVQLVSGSNIINHKLTRTLKGWFITRMRAPATIYDTQDTNAVQDVTLNLVSSALVTVDIYVF